MRLFGIFPLPHLFLACCVLALPPSAAAATFRVSTFTDDNGPCLPADCSVREALLAAHATPEADLIEVPPGLHQLSLPWTETEGGIPTSTGALHVAGIEVEIRGLPGGEAIIDGGGVAGVLTASEGSVLRLADLTLQNGDGYVYGGIYIAGQLEMVRCTVRNNRASSGFGGGLRVTFGTARIYDSSFVNNVALRGGGGIVFQSHAQGSLLLVNSTVSGNSALGGGGIDASGTGFLEVVHSTIADNTAISPSDGFSNRIDDATFINTIFSGDRCTVYPPERPWPTSNGGNLESPGSTCFDPADGDLTALPSVFLGPLGNYGGPTPTRSLLAGSPAIGRAQAADCLPTDQRGIARPQGIGCDAGAFELEEGAGELVDVPTLGALGQLLLASLFAWAALARFGKS